MRASKTKKRNEKTNFSVWSQGLYERAKAGVCAAISHGWNMYRWGPRFLNWGPGPELYGRSPHLYVFHPWEIRTQNPYCALSRGCLADPVRDRCMVTKVFCITFFFVGE